MKQHKIGFLHIFLILIGLCCIFATAPRVLAAQVADTAMPERYGVTVTIVYSGSLDPSDELPFCHANAFVLADMDGRYALAEYSEEKESYIVIDFTSSRDDATRFSCGCNLSRLSELSILGLPAGDYLLTHIATQDGWRLLSDSVAISVSGTGAVVDGHEIDLSHTKSADGIVTFKIAIPQAFELSLPGSGWFYRTFGSPLPLFLGLILLLGTCTSAIFLWRKSSEKCSIQNRCSED